MPIAICPDCQRRFVIEEERSPQRTCPRCLHPMELALGGAAPADQPVTLDAPEAIYLNGEPLAASEIGRRLLAVLAEAGYQSGVARQLRGAARAQRGAAKPVPVGAGVAPARPPALPAVREAPARGPAVVGQAEQLLQQARSAAEQARAARIEARITQGRSRVAREDRRSRPHSGSLPPLEYVLLPLEAPLRFFPVVEEEVAGGPEAASSPPAIGATLYVWGCEPPRSLLCREQCEASESAARFAAEAGWEANRPGAWAGEITLPLTMNEALRTLEPLLREDPGVAGWGIRRSN
jgi:hypothetical protein